MSATLRTNPEDPARLVQDRHSSFNWEKASGCISLRYSPYNSIYALDATSGTMRWSFPTGNAVTSSPAVANGLVYIGSDDGSVYVLYTS